MMRLTMVAGALLALALLGARSTSGEVDRTSCFKEVGQFYAKHQVPGDVEALVAAFKEAKPDFLDCSVPIDSSNFAHPAQPAGCAEVIEIEYEANHLYRCYDDMDVYEKFFLDLAAANQSGRPIVEAYVACDLNERLIYEDERATCVIEVGEFLANYQPSTGVVSLVSELREARPNSTNLGMPVSDHYIDSVPAKMPSGCQEIEGLVKHIVGETCFQKSYGYPFLRAVADVYPESGPLIVAIDACLANKHLLDVEAAGQSPDGAE